MNLVIVGFLVLSTIFVGAAVAPSIFLVEQDKDPVIFFQEEQEFVPFVNQTILDSNEYDPDRNTFSTWRNFDFTHNDKGDVDIFIERQKTTMMFAITGNASGQPFVTTSRDFSWNWNVETEDLNLFDRITHRYTLTGKNRGDLNMTQSWFFYENNYPKVTYTVNNNLTEITDTTFWFVYVLNVNDLVEFDEIKRLVNNNSFVRLNNINDREKILNFHDTIGIDWSDLNATGFETTDILLGKGDIIGKPDLIVAAFGVTKNNGVFPLGATVELDPTIFNTTDKFAFQAYNESFDWINIVRLKRNLPLPNRYAQVTLNGKRVDLNQFGRPDFSDGNNMEIPFGAEIRGIEVLISAKMIAGLCGTPAETGTLQVRMLVDGSVHSTLKFNTWSCTEGEVTKIYGSPTDLWSADWNNTHFDYNTFVLSILTSGFTNGGQWGPPPNAGVNFAKLKVYYSQNCFYSGLFDFDCNCSEGISSQPGDIDLTGNDFNIAGEGTFEIRTNITNIGTTNVESTCRVDKFDGFVLS